MGNERLLGAGWGGRGCPDFGFLGVLFPAGSPRAGLGSGGYLGGTQLFAGWEIFGHLISRCFSLQLLWSYEIL